MYLTPFRDASAIYTRDQPVKPLRALPLSLVIDRQFLFRPSALASTVVNKRVASANANFWKVQRVGYEIAKDKIIMANQVWHEWR